MKSRIGAVVVVLAALACGIAFSQEPPVPDPEADRVDRLEQELAATRLRVESLSTELADTQKQMTHVLRYLEDQAKAASAMEGVIDQAERAGFTYGINADSRHILLRGWRDQLATAQKDVEPQPLPAPAPAVGRAPAKPRAE